MDADTRHRGGEGGGRPRQAIARSRMGVGIALGVAIGAAVGVSTHNLAMGTGVGAALGVVVGAALDRIRRGRS